MSDECTCAKCDEPTAEDFERMAKFQDAMATYFENRPTQGEDLSVWANASNAKNCIISAGLLREAAERRKPVKIKPLEWSDHHDGGLQAVPAGLVRYRVHRNGDDWYLNHDHMGKGGKEAAQADYEARIRSALVDGGSND